MNTFYSVFDSVDCENNSNTLKNLSFKFVMPFRVVEAMQKIVGAKKLNLPK